MKKYRLTLRTLEPTIVKSDFSNIRAETVDYIPGSIIRGAVANTYLKYKGKDDFFTKCFDDGKVIFQNLYPINENESPDNVKISAPLPKTAVSCKRHGGFIADKMDDREKHGVCDILFKKIANQQIDKCRCKEKLSPFAGFYNLKNDGVYRGCGDLSTRTFTHTAINPVTRTVMKEKLYSLEALLENQVFAGDILVKDETLVIGDLIGKFPLKIGKSRTRGYGKVSIESLRELEIESLDNFSQRIATIIETGTNEIRGKLLIFTLLSDVILYDKYLRYLKKMDEKWLRQKGIEGRLVYCNFSNIETFGWNAAWGLPKPKELAIQKGSVFVFELTDELNDNIVNILYEMQTEGIGVRKEEGFGRISINDDFHFSLREGQK